MSSVDNGYQRNANILENNILTIDYIRSLKLDENKKYKVTVINKNENSQNDKIEPAKEILQGKIISQHNYVFVFGCISRVNQPKRVCINKIDYILNKNLIKECK